MSTILKFLIFLANTCSEIISNARFLKLIVEDNNFEKMLAPSAMRGCIH